MKDSSVYTCIFDTPLGKAQAAARDNAIIGLWFIGQKYFPLKKITDNFIQKMNYPVFTELENWLKEYFAGKKPAMKIKLAPELSDKTSEFRLAVWKILTKIPYGKTTTYKAISDKLISSGKKSAAQAVGGAVGHNPISILIPCHRVLGSDGSLTGFAGGIDKKTFLLNLERGNV